MASYSSNSARSLVNNYELALLEANHLKLIPSCAKLYKCFEIFDEIIPMLGQFKRVMKLIRDQVYEAVFSQQYTVGIQPENVTQTVTVKSSVERVPYFDILNKIVDERNSRTEVAEEQVGQLKNLVEELNEEIDAFKKDISEAEFVVAKQREEIHDLQTNLVAKEQESTRLDIELLYQQEKMNRKAKDFENSIENLNEQLVHESSKVNELGRFKKCHDAVQNDFRDPTVFSPVPHKGFFSAKEKKLRKDIAEGTIIEKQISTLRNTCIEEYDLYLQCSHFKENERDEPSEVRPNEPQSSDQPMKDEKRETAFINMIGNIESELAQNVLHLSILKNDLDQFNEVKGQSKINSEKLLTDGAEGHSMDDDSQLLELIRDASMNYKFVPQEPILSKYALVALYSCNQGKTFQELPSVNQCTSCDANTLVCAHKATTGERVFHLPLQCTHIKFTRPAIQVPHSSHSDTPEKTSKTAREETKSQKAYPKLWNDLALRESSSYQRIPRILQKEFLDSLIEQFYASVVLDDVNNGEQKLLHMLEKWYAFLNDRYQSKSVAISVATDVMETIQCSVPLQPFFQMFAKCLCGNLDPSAFRYYLILRRLVQIVHWTSLENFSAFSSIVYPFMDVDDLEQFTMSFRAFGKNRIDETLVLRFFLSLILKQRESAFHDMENQLLSRPEVTSGVMTDIVFFDSMAEIEPLGSERLCQLLYAQSQADTEGSHVSITRLSQIASYLVLHQQSAVMEMDIRKTLQIY